MTNTCKLSSFHLCFALLIPLLVQNVSFGVETPSPSGILKPFIDQLRKIGPVRLEYSHFDAVPPEGNKISHKSKAIVTPPFGRICFATAGDKNYYLEECYNKPRGGAEFCSIFVQDQLGYLFIRPDFPALFFPAQAMTDSDLDSRIPRSSPSASLLSEYGATDRKGYEYAVNPLLESLEFLAIPDRYCRQSRYVENIKWSDIWDDQFINFILDNFFIVTSVTKNSVTIEAVNPLEAKYLPNNEHPRFMVRLERNNGIFRPVVIVKNLFWDPVTRPAGADGSVSFKDASYITEISYSHDSDGKRPYLDVVPEKVQYSSKINSEANLLTNYKLTKSCIINLQDYVKLVTDCKLSARSIYDVKAHVTLDQ